MKSDFSPISVAKVHKNFCSAIRFAKKVQKKLRKHRPAAFQSPKSQTKHEVFVTDDSPNISKFPPFSTKNSVIFWKKAAL